MGDDGKQMHFKTAAQSHRALLIFLAVYALILLFFLDKKPLMLDEILDLVGVRDSTVREVLNFVPTNAGGAPLGYLCDLAIIRLLGYSVFAVRLPSVVFSLIGCVGVYRLAQAVLLRQPLWATICYAIFPLQFRYAMIARPYSQAAGWSILSTVVFFKLIQGKERASPRPTMAWAALYALLATAGLYTHPYTIFVPIAHFLWLVCNRSLDGRKRSLILAGRAIAAASLAFLPWFLTTHAAWQKIIGFGASPYFGGSAKGLLLVAHELTGAGYVGFGLALISVVLGLRPSPGLEAGQRLFWILYLVIPLLCVLAANVLFGYFLAIRQFIFILVPLAILIAMAAEAFVKTGRPRGVSLAPGFLVIAMLYANVRLLGQPGEGWQAAASTLGKLASVRGTCVLFVPPDAQDTFVFFEPQLARTLCDSEDLSAWETVIVVLRANGPVRFYSEANRSLDQAGFSKAADLRAEEPRLEIYRRPKNPVLGR